MAALTTHVLFGLLIGLGLRVRLRYLPLCILAAGFMDIDNMFFARGEPDPWWITRRASLQNLWFFVVLPTLTGLVAYFWPRVKPELKRVAAALPAITGTHMLHDMILAYAPYKWNTGLMLLFPFSETRWTFD
ncbi:MAG: hypothetical protein R3185_08315, partial [Candidatus Thermoplasmatota archaeon]|nr:hypothetical protein [Candidatus Thermoplasmatota archaeon]